jgi:hypothetical protein
MAGENGAMRSPEAAEPVAAREQLDVQHYIDLVLSGRRRKVQVRLRPKRTKLPSTLPWS